MGSELEGSTEGTLVGVSDGELVRSSVGLGVAAIDGASLGPSVGVGVEGSRVGVSVGRGVGKLVGYSVGGVVGIQLGPFEGMLVDGSEVGVFVVGSELEGETVLGVNSLCSALKSCIAPHFEVSKAKGMGTRTASRTLHTMGWQQMVSACSVSKLGCEERYY